MNVTKRGAALGMVFAAIVSTPSAFGTDPEYAFTTIQGGHTGTWYNLDQPGHGLFVEVLNDAASLTGKEVIVAWFAYIDGQRTWLLAQGDVIDVDDGQQALLDVTLYEGNDFPPGYDPGQTVGMPWGSMILTFNGCEEAYLEWDSSLTQYGTGALDLRRGTKPAESTCNPELGGGTPLDDHGDTWTAGTFLSNLGVFAQSIDGNLEEPGDVDVFLFTLTSGANFRVYTLGPGHTNTMGILYEVVDNQEVLVDMSDDNEVDDGFEIEAYLAGGNYALHVQGSSEAVRGAYRLYYEAK